MHCAPDAIAIGIDIGATQTRVAAVDGSGLVSSLRLCGTVGRDMADQVGWPIETEPRAQWNPDLSGARAGRRDGNVATGGDLFDAFVTSLTRMVAEVGAEACPGPTTDRTVGLAIPGTLDPPRDAVVRSVNLPFLEGRRLGEELGQRIGRSVILLTDAEASTWGEFHIREQQPESFVHLRLGSGVACGIVLEGKLQRLDAGRTGHLDVLVINDGPDAPQCRCGRRGCLEAVASGAALTERASMLGITDGITGLQTAWERRDEAARRLVREAAAGVVTASRKLTECYHADVICVGGGVVAHLPSLLKEVVDSCTSSSTCLAEQRSWSVEPARLGDDAGFIGAALLAVQHDRLRA